jgi:hypothetical protein
MDLDNVRKWHRATTNAMRRHADGDRTSIHIPAGDLNEMTSFVLAMVRRVKEDKEKAAKSAQE